MVMIVVSAPEFRWARFSETSTRAPFFVASYSHHKSLKNLANDADGHLEMPFGDAPVLKGSGRAIRNKQPAACGIVGQSPMPQTTPERGWGGVNEKRSLANKPVTANRIR